MTILGGLISWYTLIYDYHTSIFAINVLREREGVCLNCPGGEGEREGGDRVIIDTVSCVSIRTRFPPEMYFSW